MAKAKTKKSPLTKEVLEFFRKHGSTGGKARAKKHPAKQRRRWARMGGRPLEFCKVCSEKLSECVCEKKKTAVA